MMTQRNRAHLAQRILRGKREVKAGKIWKLMMKALPLNTVLQNAHQHLKALYSLWWLDDALLGLVLGRSLVLPLPVGYRVVVPSGHLVKAHLSIA